MKNILLFIILFSFSFANGQSLPIDFEGNISTVDFEDFNGGTAMVLDNPVVGGINMSGTVAQIVRDGGEIWAGSKIVLAENLDFSTLNRMSMKVFTSAPVGTVMKFKLEGDGAMERDVVTTVSGEWEELIWDFTGVPAVFNTVVFMFDFGNVGDGSAGSTFLFDDVEQLFGGTQIDWPVDFEGAMVNYTMSDFGGNVSSLEVDPADASNTVIQTIKTNQAATWAGTTIGTPAGFVRDLPLTLSDSKMTVRVWSPAAGTPIRLKVEDSNDVTHTCETETNTTVAGWEELEFDFANQAPGTESLSVGLSMGWTYNMASIFFNFGTNGETAGEATYYFDEVRFGGLTVGTDDLETVGVTVFPNPTYGEWTIDSDGGVINSVEIFDLQGRRVLVLQPNAAVVKIDASGFVKGVYIARIRSEAGVGSVRLLRE